jgi:hypothetical protein
VRRQHQQRPRDGLDYRTLDEMYYKKLKSLSEVEGCLWSIRFGAYARPAVAQWVGSTSSR